MSVSSASFRADLNAFQRKLGIAPLLVVKKIAFQLHDDIVVRTPVDTGRARSNWNIAIGDNPDLSTKEEYAYHAAAASKKSVLTTMSVLDRIWITNSLPYIEALENGHSQQAPAGMVKLAVMDIEKEINQTIAAL